ncbi:MAG TPA: SsgA family sporulation/cell division regulator [Mycobacteriales bacterium]|nr:SsgA family sporulation/cell division regulator [Mycobacteriales bacterium]
MEDESVVADVVVEAGTGRGRRTVLQLSWTPADPLAVVLTLTALPDHPALPRGSWVVLRDFLRYGLEEPTGDGVVRIRPDEDGDCVVLALARAGRPASVALPREAVRAFLDRTERVVATGAEASDVAIDALLARLLGEEPPAR